jgi:predicted transcriptional regulator
MSQDSSPNLKNEADTHPPTTTVSMTDILGLPVGLRQLLNWMVKTESVTVRQVAEQVGQDEKSAHELLLTLVKKGWIVEVKAQGETRYRVQLSAQRKRLVPSSLLDVIDGPAKPRGVSRLDPSPPNKHKK